MNKNIFVLFAVSFIVAFIMSLLMTLNHDRIFGGIERGVADQRLMELEKMSCRHEMCHHTINGCCVGEVSAKCEKLLADENTDITDALTHLKGNPDVEVSSDCDGWREFEKKLREEMKK